MNAEQSNTTQAMNSNEKNNKYPKDNPLAQTEHNETTSSYQDTENVSANLQQSKVVRTILEIRYRISSQVETRTSTVRTEGIWVGNANGGTENKSSTIGGSRQTQLERNQVSR